MRRDLYINVTPNVVRTAILEDGSLVEMYVEYGSRRSLVGNIYKAEVRKVIPGIAGAFVDIGEEKDGFLYVNDLLVEDDWEAWFRSRGDGKPGQGRVRIGDHLRRGQTIRVQVIRDGLGDKGPRVTSQLALPGTYMVLAIGRSFVGVSRKIDDEKERKRLRTLAKRIAKEVGGGVIIRTAAEGVPEENLLEDAKKLSSVRDSIMERSDRAPVPSRLHADLSLPLRVVRDLAGKQIHSVTLDDRGAYEDLMEYRSLIPRGDSFKVIMHEGRQPLFEEMGIEKDLSRALKPKIWLKHGGYLVINQTEALVAIDVNSGKFISRGNLESTAFKTNMEAVPEIVRQIRLRGLGGIIVLDMIDMMRASHRDQVLASLKKELEKDRSHSKLLKISSFGLVEMTRKRTQANLLARLTMQCPECNGSGRTKNTTIICLDLYNEIKKAADSLVEKVHVRAHPDVIAKFKSEWGDEGGWLDRLEIVFQEAEGHIEEFQIVVS